MVFRASPSESLATRIDDTLLGEAIGQREPILSSKLALSRADVALMVLGLLFGAASLTFPFGHDQGVHYYVGREWLRHGALPYRDTFDYKTPGIYIVYAALIAVLGEGMWPIRLAELACAVWLGWICARLADDKPKAGMLGLSVFLVTFSYYGFFNYWDTAQCELSCLTFSFAAILGALRGDSTTRSWGWTGLVAGAALLMKPSAVGFILVALGLTCHRAPGRRLRAAATFSVATVALPALVFGYFFAKGGAASVAEIVAADHEYLRDTRWVHSATDLWRISLSTFNSFAPFSALLLGAFAEAALRARLTRSFAPVRRFALPAVTAVAAYVGVAAQLKFYRYHSVLFVGPGVLAALALGRALFATWRVPASKGALVTAFALLGFFPLAGANASNWFDETASAIGLVDGTLTRQKFDRRFFAPNLYYDYADSEACGLWLRDHTKPDDTIAVRGFEAEIYAIAERRFTGRFFWTIPLTDPQRTFKHDAYIAEDLAALRANPPHYVVALADAHAPAEGARYFEPLGYRRVETFGRLIVLEKDRPEMESRR